MDQMPNEILLKIFSHLDVQDLGRCAQVSKKFQKIAYDRAIWQELPINLAGKQVPIEFIQNILERGTAYLNLSYAQIVGDSSLIDQPNFLKYLNLDFTAGQVHVRSLLNSCTKLEKLCYFGRMEDNISIVPCVRRNSKSLKCLKIHAGYFTDEDAITAISNCKLLEELALWQPTLLTNFLCKNLPGNLKKLNLGNGLKIEDLKVLVAQCSKLKDLFCGIDCCNNDTCRHFDEIISIVAESSLSNTLVNLELRMNKRIHIHEQIDAKCLELGKMKKLKNIEIESGEISDILRRNLPHLTVGMNENILFPANPYPGGLWEISCNQLNLFPGIEY